MKRKRPCGNGTVRECRIPDPSTEHDVTLQGIADLFPERDVLVDYFRCDLGKYHYDAGKIEPTVSGLAKRPAFTALRGLPPPECLERTSM